MNFYLSTIDPNARQVALDYGLGIEIAEYCTAWNMDDKFAETHPVVQSTIDGFSSPILHGPFNELFPCAIDPMVRDIARHRYRQAIALAQQYGAKKVVIHGGYNPRLYYPIWYTEQSIVFWKDFVQEIPEGMQIVLENVMEETIDMFLDIITAVNDSRLRMCFDIGHANAYSENSVMEWLVSCAPYISHFHIHNNDGSWDNHCSLPDGTIPMEAFLIKANQLCPKASFTLELVDSASSVRWLHENGLLEG